MTDAPVSTIPSPPRSPLLWGIFCACSWTWCIGMYLPVILIGRLGWAGFIAFAIPNVLGCAGMAFVLRAIGRRRNETVASTSDTMTSTHGAMMVAFSIVTVAFQTFFAVWLVSELIPQMGLAWWSPFAVGAVVYGLGLLFAFFNDRDWLALAIVTYVVSIAALAAVGTSAFRYVPMRGSLPAPDVWWMLPILCFGFGLCPYLDLTFHRAARTASQPRAAFTIFGIAFAIMLALTVMLWFHPRVWYLQLVALCAMGHIIAQLIFTIGAHLREVRLTSAFQCNKRRTAVMLLPLTAIAAFAAARMLVDPVHAGEWTYLTFLGAYGLVFPAYVIVAMATGQPLRSRAEWSAYGAVILACLPAVAAGFIFHRTMWLAVPVVLFAVWGHFRKGFASPH